MSQMERRAFMKGAAGGALAFTAGFAIATIVDRNAGALGIGTAAHSDANLAPSS